jgi:hypothetical protein
VALVMVKPEVTRAVSAPVAAARQPTTLGPAEPPRLARRLAGRLGHEWLPRATWTMRRTGRSGLVGIALLLAATLFLFSTHRKVAAEVEALRADLATAQRQALTAPTDEVGVPAPAMRVLPARTDMPGILRQVFDEATGAGLAIDTARYEINATRTSGVVRYQIAFPVTGPYPQIRAFIDATLATLPEVAISELALERKSIADGDVEAKIRMTVYTRSEP